MLAVSFTGFLRTGLLMQLSSFTASSGPASKYVQGLLHCWSDVQLGCVDEARRDFPTRQTCNSNVRALLFTLSATLAEDMTNYRLAAYLRVS
jgi:hypothetical protein